MLSTKAKDKHWHCSAVDCYFTHTTLDWYQINSTRYFYQLGAVFCLVWTTRTSQYLLDKFNWLYHTKLLHRITQIMKWVFLWPYNFMEITLHSFISYLDQHCLTSCMELDLYLHCSRNITKNSIFHYDRLKSILILWLLRRRNNISIFIHSFFFFFFWF